MITPTLNGYLSEHFDFDIKGFKTRGLDKPSVFSTGRVQRYDI